MCTMCETQGTFLLPWGRVLLCLDCMRLQLDLLAAATATMTAEEFEDWNSVGRELPADPSGPVYEDDGLAMDEVSEARS